MGITLTIFTPTYNRAKTLSRCYESLLRQSSGDFIWLIIDDGSTDGTGELVKEWQSRKNGFEIRYYYKENGGIHTAFNVAYQRIDTELNLCLGSDDYLTNDAVESIISYWRKNGSQQYAGMIALNRYDSGKVIGRKLPERKSIHLQEYYRNGGKGDKKLIYRTEIVQSYPEYPVFEGERFLSVGYKFLLIDQHYPLLVMNQPICIVEYSKDGYTKNMSLLRVGNPRGFAFMKRTELGYEKGLIYRIKLTTQYIAYSQMAKDKHYIKSVPDKFMIICLLPAGAMMGVLIKFMAFYHKKRRT